jgi:hypothetical protein
MKAPTWSRLLYRFSRVLSVVDVAQQIVRDELLFAYLQPEQRSVVTFDAYAKNSNYVPGGEFFSQGLFAWELALLEDSRVPRSGRVLLAAAGGGRELHALLQRGYEVCAFEPVAPLFDSAREVARGAKATVAKATYQDLVARAEGRPGPLDGWRGPFDFCVLGWGSLSHLTEPTVVLDVLRAFRSLAPSAPIMASFFVRSSGQPATTGGARKLRRVLRGTLAIAGGRPVAAGLRFLTAAGFIYAFSREELVSLCGDAGYEVALFDDCTYPHALLLPRTVESAD